MLSFIVGAGQVGFEPTRRGLARRPDPKSGAMKPDSAHCPMPIDRLDEAGRPVEAILTDGAGADQGVHGVSRQKEARAIGMAQQGFIVLTMRFRQDGKRWLAMCEELGTSTYARTLKQAQLELAELVALHLNTLEDVGERERFFREHHIRLQTHAPRQPVTRTVPVSDDWLTQLHRAPVGAPA